MFSIYISQAPDNIECPRTFFLILILKIQIIYSFEHISICKIQPIVISTQKFNYDK